ncbi:MAG: hypothetical protein N4A43_01990 [Alphaproteobacteria bacterium]|jgi:hypothetical protein|nr:hypothetical protein [Alphaproteobacteria bacterium]
MKHIFLILICILTYNTASACNNHGAHNRSYYRIETKSYNHEQEELLDDNLTSYEEDLEESSFSQDI